MRTLVLVVELKGTEAVIGVADIRQLHPSCTLLVPNVCNALGSAFVDEGTEEDATS